MHRIRVEIEPENMFALELQSLHEQLPSAEWADGGCDGSVDIWDRTTLHVKLIYQIKQRSTTECRYNI